MMSDFMSALHFFESTAKILKLAETRIICAGTVLEVEDGADDRASYLHRVPARNAPAD
jgi:hypothetical protein